jgi:hypothetical protein
MTLASLQQVNSQYKVSLKRIETDSKTPSGPLSSKRPHSAVRKSDTMIDCPSPFGSGVALLVLAIQ